MRHLAVRPLGLISLPDSPLREPHAWLRRRDGEPGARRSIVRIAEDAMAPRVRVGDYVRVDPGHGGETVVRLLSERDGRRLLRALDERCPERTADARNRSAKPWN